MPQPVGRSLRQYTRGLAGGLLFSLPLLYTMELWWAGFLAGPERLLVFALATFLLLLGYNRFSGFRRDRTWTQVLVDSCEEMGIGILLAALVLALLGRITPWMESDEILGKIVVESMLVAIGVSVGRAQLGLRETSGGPGAGGSGGGAGGDEGEPSFAAQTVIGVCGAVLVAANVAPTEEIVRGAVEIGPLRLLAIAALSMLTGAGILYGSDFVGSRRHVRRAGGRFAISAGAVTMYGVALAVSALLLWFFGRFAGESAATRVAETVVLALPAALGASAGRLLLQA